MQDLNSKGHTRHLTKGKDAGYGGYEGFTGNMFLVASMLLVAGPGGPLAASLLLVAMPFVPTLLSSFYLYPSF